MKFVMYQDCVSPHQLPLARELVKQLGSDNFRYVYRDKEQGDRVELGWQMSGDEVWFVHIGSHPIEARELIENADALLTGMREPDLFARRSAKCLKTFYCSERWFKPIPLFASTAHFHFSLPGWIKLLHPSYLRMAWHFVYLLNTQPDFYYLPIGPHAARDMRNLHRIVSILSLRMPTTANYIPWGYFVAPSDSTSIPPSTSVSTRTLRVLYVGRFLSLKRVDTIIRAVADVAKHGKTITCTLLGSGPEEARLKKLAAACQLHCSSPKIFTFLPPVPIHEVRSIMRKHDVLVFASNAFDGWGAVINEALSEGVAALGTYETGAAPALLAESQLFHCGDWRALADKLLTVPFHPNKSTLPSAYTPAGAALRILQQAGGEEV